ncbi:hypothetical protein PENSTE_c002G01963 [Penicillium steckii]|uniref:Uncharacterized protein n=1 Tax=Penicillium steckii TaxID=303698 RepID=A0A1V6TU12_9EURO|nr:hypothetical protein PENSTE_c002G01963 [Penicillium steckii]
MPQRVSSQFELETLGSAGRNSAVLGREKRDGSNLTVRGASLAAEGAAQSKYSGHRSGAYGTQERLESESRMRRTTRWVKSQQQESKDKTRAVTFTDSSRAFHEQGISLSTNVVGVEPSRGKAPAMAEWI